MMGMNNISKSRCRLWNTNRHTLCWFLFFQKNNFAHAQWVEKLIGRCIKRSTGEEGILAATGKHERVWAKLQTCIGNATQVISASFPPFIVVKLTILLNWLFLLIRFLLFGCRNSHFKQVQRGLDNFSQHSQHKSIKLVHLWPVAIGQKVGKSVFERSDICQQNERPENVRFVVQTPDRHTENAQNKARTSPNSHLFRSKSTTSKYSQLRL